LFSELAHLNFHLATHRCLLYETLGFIAFFTFLVLARRPLGGRFVLVFVICP
jgi:hypothetical protein